jgi:hypothetical protein
MTRRSLRCPRVEESLEVGREGGLIEFEVGGEVVEMEDEGFKVE